MDLIPSKRRLLPVAHGNAVSGYDPVAISLFNVSLPKAVSSTASIKYEDVFPFTSIQIADVLPKTIRILKKRLLTAANAVRNRGQLNGCADFTPVINQARRINTDFSFPTTLCADPTQARAQELFRLTDSLTLIDLVSSRFATVRITATCALQLNATLMIDAKY